jgi:hypothetical protein
MHVPHNAIQQVLESGGFARKLSPGTVRSIVTLMPMAALLSV